MALAPLMLKETSLSTTTSEAFMPISGMCVTPTEGKYAVFFSASVSSTVSDAECNLGIFVANTEIPDASRNVFGDADGRSPNLKMSVFTQTAVEMDGLKALSVRWKTDKGVFKIYARNLLLFPIV